MKENFKFQISNFKFLVLLFVICLLFISLSPNLYTLNPTFAQTPACITTTPRAEGLVSAPQQALNSKFGTLPGTCIIDPKASFVPFKIPSYDDLKSIYYTQSKATKVSVVGDATQTNLNFTIDSVYNITGNLNLSGNPPATATAVVFIEGNLNITADYTYGTSTTGTVFVVKGNVNIFYTPVTRVDAIIISGGTICTAFDGISCPGINVETSQLVINGSLVSLTDTAPIKFRRSLLDNTCAACAAEKINHQIKYLSILKDLFTSTSQKWSEVEGGPLNQTPPPPPPPPLPPPPPPPPPPPIAVCGNGIPESPEQCDDGNLIDTDECNNACQVQKKVFVTSASYTGILGGLTGADANCKTLADASTVAGVHGRTWMAWLSDSTNSPSTRFTTKNNGPYVKIVGSKVADDWADLTDGSLDSFISVDEKGNPVLANVWTNTLSTGASGGTSHCTSWTNLLGNTPTGNTYNTNPDWTFAFSNACTNSSYRLYCFEQ